MGGQHLIFGAGGSYAHFTYRKVEAFEKNIKSLATVGTTDEVKGSIRTPRPQCFHQARGSSLAVHYDLPQQSPPLTATFLRVFTHPCPLPELHPSPASTSPSQNPSMYHCHCHFLHPQPLPSLGWHHSVGTCSDLLYPRIKRFIFSASHLVSSLPLLFS